ncbi:hypothetical protein F4604DRAFT_1681630 [Suillus subluteus]|nr:hypothetical protein F4604DRAFT_1681630 [Suillus subluteus]
MGRTKRLRVVLSDSSGPSLSDYDDLEIATPLVEPQVGSPPRRTRRPNAGKGGAASQLRRAGEAVIDVPGRRTDKGRQFVIPDGEPENIMVPSPVKKRIRKKGQKAAVPAVTTPDQSDDAGSAPSMRVAEPGERFGLQKNPIPLGYVGLKPLGSEGHPEHQKSRIQRDRPCSHTHMEVSKRPAVELSAPIIPHLRLSNPPVRKKLSGAETKHHSNKDMSEVDYGSNMVDDDKFPPSNDEMHTSPPIKSSLDRSADENEDIGHTHRCQGQAERRVDHLAHASRKDDRQNRRKDHMCHSGFTVNQPNTKYARTSNLQSNNNRQAAGDSDGDMKVDTDSEVQHTKVGCLTMAVKNAQGGVVVAKRKTLGFFPDLWVKLLNYTKACFRLHLAIADPFPAREEALSDTGICLEPVMESIVAWEAQNRCLEAGFYPQYEYDMATVSMLRQIYNDSINFHSRIKQIVINIVPVEYKLSGSESEIKQKATLLLVATIVCNVLHVYSMYGHVNTKQTALGDSEKVYHKLTHMLKQVADDEYHSEKLDEALRSWTMAGMTRVVVDDEPQDIESDSDWVVELD